MPIPYRTLLAHGGLAFPLAATFLCLQVYVPTYYAAAMGLSLSAVGGVLLVARLWDSLTDPVIGYLSDRSPARLGRRRLWVLLGTPFVALAAWAIFVPPEAPSSGYLLGWTVAIYLAGTMVIVPLNAWGAELSPDYQERSRVTGIRALFGLVGTLAVLLLPASLGFGDARDLGRALEVNLQAILATLVLTIAVMWAVVPDRSVVRLPAAPLSASLSVLRGQSPFRTLLAAFLVNGIANAIPATLFLFYVTHILERPDLAGPLLVAYFLAAALATPFWVLASKHLGKCRSWRIAMSVACAAFVWSPFLGPEQVILFLAIVLITGFAAGADLVLPSALQADVIDWDELTSGYRRAGLFFAFWGTATKLAFALAVGITFPLLDLGGFRTAGANSHQALTLLAVTYGGLPVLLKLGALFLMRDYPITRQAHESIRARLALGSGQGR